MQLIYSLAHFVEVVYVIKWGCWGYMIKPFKTFGLSYRLVVSLQMYFCFGSVLISFSNLGESERIQEEQQRLKAAQRKRDEEAIRQKKRLQEEGADDDGDLKEPPRETKMIPEQLNGLPTHSCQAIYEMIENGIVNQAMTNLEPSQLVQVFFQESLPQNKDLQQVVKAGPIFYQASEEQLQSPPVWWNECVAQLERHCIGSIPEGETPASFVPCLHIQHILSFGLEFSCHLFQFLGGYLPIGS